MLLSNNTTLRPLGSLSGVTLPAGRRGTLPCYKGKKTIAWHVTVTGDVVVGTAAATAIVDTGSILSIFDECGLNDGADRLPSNPLDNRYLTEAMSAKPLAATRMTTLTVGTKSLKERFSVFGSFPFALRPEDVAFMEKNVDGDFVFYIKQTNAADGGGSRIATAGGGGGTVVVQNVVVTVRQEYIAMGGTLPVFQPRWEQDIIAISGTNAALPKQFLKNYYMQGMLLRQDISGGPRVGDVLTALKLTATERVIIGDEVVALDDVQAELDKSFAGTTYTLGGVNPYLFLFFQRGGKLSKIIRPNDPNFKGTLSVQNSATAGTSEIQVTYFLLERDNTVRRDGSRITMSQADLQKTGLRI
jgi:hypothetical protein